jgi:nucleoside-diphosphate-sugar epimerase
MKILVTGANGFIGGAVCSHLLAEGWQVFGAVRRDVRLPDGVVPRRIADIGPDTAWVEALVGIDAVVHLAARVHVMHEDADDPLAAFRRANTAGTLRLAHEAARLEVRRFIFMSTIKVNGESTGEHPFTVEDLADPRDPYGQSKWEAEQGLHRLAAVGGMKTTILRPPLVYGPGVGGNFRSLLKAVAAGWPLPLGAVDNRRSMIYALNLADVVATCLREPAGACETFLICDGKALSTADLIRRLAHLLGRSPRLPRVPPALLHVVGRCLGKGAMVDRLIGSLEVDDRAVRTRYDWHPPYALDDGLAETVAWFTRHASV